MSEQLEKCKYADKYKGIYLPKCGCKRCINIYAVLQRKKGFLDGYAKGLSERAKGHAYD